MAYQWNQLLQLFNEVDNIFCNGTYSLSGWSFRKRVWFTTFTVMIFALVEHLLFWYSFLHDRFVEAETCNLEVESWIYFIVNIQFINIFKVFPMNSLSIFWTEYMNISFTFAWSFIDLFIIIMSMSIATKFKMINERLEIFKGRVSHYKVIC